MLDEEDETLFGDHSDNVVLRAQDCVERDQLAGGLLLLLTEVQARQVRYDLVGNAAEVLAASQRLCVADKLGLSRKQAPSLTESSQRLFSGFGDLGRRSVLLEQFSVDTAGR